MTKQELEEDINIGDVLNFKTIDKDFVGKVESFGETGVKIISLDSNKPKRISYDLIKEYDFEVSISYNDTSEVIKQKSLEIKEIQNTKKTNLIENTQISDVNSFLSNMFKKSNYEEVGLNFDEVFKSIKGSLSSEMQSEMSKIKSWLIDAKKCHEDGYEHSRIRKIFTQFEKLSENMIPEIFILKGALNFEYGLKSSIMDFEKGQDYQRAFYAAEFFNSETEILLKYAINSVNLGISDNYICDWILQYSISSGRKDVAKFIYDKEEEKRKIAIFCIYNESDVISELPNKSDIGIEENVLYLQEFLQKETFDMSKIDELIIIDIDKLHEEKINDVQKTYLNGEITYFNQERLFGSIGEVFFHIRQVSDVKLQNFLLKTNINKIRKLNVKYVLGRTRQGRIAADDIQLINQNETSDENQNLTGKIVEYNQFDFYGIIIHEGKSYRFNFNQVTDIVLSKLLDLTYDKLPIYVVFDLSNVGGKKIAANVRYALDIPREKATELIKKKIITPEELEKRNLFVQNSKNINKESDISLDYEPLIPIESSIDVGINKLSSSLENAVDNFYFEVARQAEQYEKNLDKAIQNYRIAIDKGQNLSSSVLNLALIYSRLENKEEALNILAKYKFELDYGRYLNTKIAVLSKTIEAKYGDELLSSYDEMLRITKNPDKVYLLKVSKARALYLLDKSKEAETICKNLLAKNRDENQKKTLLVMLCNIKIKEKEFNIAKEIADKILEINPEDAFAKSVINNSLCEKIEEIEADIFDYIGGTGVSSFITEKLEQLSLITQIKKANMIDNDNRFIGSEDEADSIINAFFDNQRTLGNDNQKADNRFTIASLIRQIIDKSYENNISIKNNKRFNEKTYLENVAFGALYYGNSRLYTSELSKNVDTSRYCYLEAAKIFKDFDNIHPCWYSAILSYFITFFKPEGESIKQFQITKFRDSDLGYEEVLKNVFEYKIQNIPGFIIGLFDYFEYDEKNRSTILELIFDSKNKDSILEYMKNVFDIETETDYLSYFNKCLGQYLNLRQMFIKDLDSAILNIFTYGVFSQYCDQIKESKFLTFLNSTDKLIVEHILDIFNKVRKYKESPDFGYKSDLLKDVEEKRQNIDGYIQANATKFGWEIISKRIESLNSKFYIESKSLYSATPQIEIDFVHDTVNINTEKNQVDITIVITNKSNVQDADNAAISVLSDKAELIVSDELATNFIKGDGIRNEKLYSFKLNPSILKEKILPVTVSVSYQYNKTMTEIETNLVSQTLSIPLEKIEFEEIDNKFEKYKDGAQVEDDSMFFGRDKDIEQIIGEICDPSGKVHSGKSLALYGQTRTGKSSLLYHLAKKLREINSDKNIIINIGSLGELDLSGSLYDFLYTLLDALEVELKDNHFQLYEKLIENDIDVSPDRLSIETYQIQFNKIFKDFCRFVELNYNVLVMIDEFTYVYDWIRQEIMTDRFMKFWKAFIQNNGIYAIIIGQDHMMKFVSDPRFTNDFGSTVKNKVTYLSENDAKALMEQPILYRHNGIVETRYKEGALDRLYELTSGSAFLIMKLCAGLVEYINNEIRFPYITKAYIDGYLKKNLSSFDEASYFEPQYSDKSSLNAIDVINKNKEILKKIAKESSRKEWASYEKVVLTDEDKEIIQNLEERDVVIIEEEQRCKIKVVLYKEWLLAKYGE